MACLSSLILLEGKSHSLGGDKVRTYYYVIFWFSTNLVIAFVLSILILKCRKVAIINLDPANDSLPYPSLCLSQTLFYSTMSFFSCIVKLIWFPLMKTIAMNVL